MAGSTALTQDLDPEDTRRLIDPVVTLMMEAVHHYEGYVAKFLGDGILALFGAPIAHEDHALRALYAALRMQDAMHRHSDRVRLEQGIPLQIRIGIHTGEVVVRSIRKDDLHTDYDPVGHTIISLRAWRGLPRRRRSWSANRPTGSPKAISSSRRWGPPMSRACATRSRCMRWLAWGPCARACRWRRTAAWPGLSGAG